MLVGSAHQSTKPAAVVPSGCPTKKTAASGWANSLSSVLYLLNIP